VRLIGNKFSGRVPDQEITSTFRWRIILPNLFRALAQVKKNIPIGSSRIEIGNTLDWAKARYYLEIADLHLKVKPI
jgi:hypothetical protein